MNTHSKHAIRIDPATGLKIFDTRAKVASTRVAGKGYGVVDNPAYRALPAFNADLAFDERAQADIKAFNDARRGADDYMPMECKFSRYLQDHYSSAPVEREALDDECEVLVVGAGFAGLLLWYRLAQAGFKDVRFCEKGGDVGGTWYWNRYPGIACDVESYSYLPLLDEMGYFPTKKFASGFEIFEYCQKVAEKYRFYDRCLFHTEMTSANWDADLKRWHVRTSRGDAMRTRFLVLANGTLTTPRLARIPGMETFQGQSFHTGRWDYDVDLNNKRVGIIGTGATAVQVIPEIAKIAAHLYVFQRTPSTIDVRDQRDTTPEEIKEWKKQPGWARQRRERFAQLIGRRALQANDAFLSGKAMRPKRRLYGDGPRLSAEVLLQRELETSFRIMEQIRARIDAVVHDPKTAAALKPYYPYGCKRPNFHDEYLPTFNQPNVTLVDVAPRGVKEINERGVVHEGKPYQLDILIYATGFEFMSHESMARVVDAKGRSLADKWAEEGTRTFLGVHSHGFPNLFIIAGPQGTGGTFNFIDAIEDHTEYVTGLLTKMRELERCVVDIRPQDEAHWAQLCAEADLATAPLRDCLTNFNGYGRAAPGSLGYYGGKKALAKLRAWAEDTLEPYQFSGSAADDEGVRSYARSLIRRC